MGEKKKKELKAVNPMLFLVAIILIVGGGLVHRPRRQLRPSL